jgi:hypothetical protein
MGVRLVSAGENLQKPTAKALSSGRAFFSLQGAVTGVATTFSSEI